MATFREIIYIVLDEIKSVNGDSYITEEHVLFLANQYRLLLLKKKIDAYRAEGVSDSDTQTICIDLEPITSTSTGICGEILLRSVQEIPSMINGTTPSIYPYNYFNTKIAYITKDRMKYVGYNKYLQNIIYCCIHDNHLYLKSNNPLFLYLEKLKLTGVFEDAEKAASLSCEGKGDEGECVDPLDKEFPMDGELVPQMIQLLVQELYQALIRSADNVNNSADDNADISAYVRRNMKSNIAKLLENGV